MAAPVPSAAHASTASMPPSIEGRLIHDCAVEPTKQEHGHAQNEQRVYPVSLRIYFDPTLRLAFFRLRAPIDIDINGETQTTPFYLDILPPFVDSLCYRRDDATSTSSFHFRITSSSEIDIDIDDDAAAIRLVAPQSIPLGGICSQTSAKLVALRSLTQQTAISISFPTHAVERMPLDHLCSAVAVRGSGAIRSHPASKNLNALYFGKGGRIVRPDEVFHHLASPSRPPPEYAPQDDNAARVTHTSGTSTKHGKRRRVSSPSYLASESDLQGNHPAPASCHTGHEEKLLAIAADLVHRFGQLGEGGLQGLLDEIDRKSRQAAENCRKLTAVIEAAAQQQAALQELVDTSSHKSIAANAWCQQPGDEATAPERLGGARRASQITTASPSSPASAASNYRSPSEDSTTSTASITSVVPNNIQNYVHEQIEQLRMELRTRYSTQEDVEKLVEQAVDIQVDKTLCYYVEEGEMQEAIKDAIDLAMADIREKVLKIWDD